MIARPLFLACLVLASPAIAHAHGLGVEVKLKGDRILIEGFYDDDTPVSDAKVAITNAEGNVIVEGMTDAKGFCSITTPVPGKYTVAIDAGSGHLAKTTFTIAAAVSEAPGPSVDATVTVSDGLTREDRTGRRWLMAGIGVAVIGLVTWGIKLVARKRANADTRGAAS